MCGALDPQCFMPSLSTGKTVALKRHHIMGKTKLNFVVIFLIQQALALRCFILKQLVVEK